jgi:hypothetical protein
MKKKKDGIVNKSIEERLAAEKRKNLQNKIRKKTIRLF